jgi:hypothetical protein
VSPSLQSRSEHLKVLLKADDFCRICCGGPSFSRC